MLRTIVSLACGALATAAGLRSGACTAPNAGQSVVSVDCNTAGATTALTFTKVNPYNGLGYLTVGGTNPSLCFAVSGTIPDDGAPAVALEVCDKTGGTPAQLFTWMLDSTVVSGLNGLCLDLETGVKAPNERLELFGCSGNANQQFNLTSAGTVVDAQWGYCLGVCQ